MPAGGAIQWRIVRTILHCHSTGRALANGPVSSTIPINAADTVTTFCSRRPHDWATDVDTDDANMAAVTSLGTILRAAMPAALSVNAYSPVHHDDMPNSLFDPFNFRPLFDLPRRPLNIRSFMEDHT